MYRFTVGKIRSGIIVYSNGDVAGALKTLDDEFDMYAIFHFLSFREKLRNGDSENLLSWRKLMEEYETRLKKLNVLESLKSRNGISTSIDLAKFGKAFVSHEFRDLRRS